MVELCKIVCSICVRCTWRLLGVFSVLCENMTFLPRPPKKAWMNAQCNIMPKVEVIAKRRVVQGSPPCVALLLVMPSSKALPNINHLSKKNYIWNYLRKSQGGSSTRLKVEDSYIQKQEIPPKNHDLQGKIIRAEFKHNFSKNIQYKTSNSKS